MTQLKGKKLILGVSGGIAAYKACDILRRLTDAGAEVHVVLTKAAQKFVTALTFQSLSQNPVHTDLFNLTEESEMSHIKLADEADLVLIAPTTADLLARLAGGRADDLLTTLVLVTRAPILLAPSMNVNMWEKEVVQNNVTILKNRGLHLIEPDEGFLACGWRGKGRLADPEAIVQVAEGLLGTQAAAIKKKSLSGLKILINAGPTREYLDPVRFLSNPSSGKMGFSLATEAQRRGAKVTLVCGPVSLSTPEGVRRIDVTTAEEMLSACQGSFQESQVFIATAAVGDYGPMAAEPQKLKKASGNISLHLKKNPDILKTLSQSKKNGQIVVGFAAETENLLENAKKKLLEKKLDLIVANEVKKNEKGFEQDQNQVVFMKSSGKLQTFPTLSKSEIAQKILDQVENLIPQCKASEINGKSPG